MVSELYAYPGSELPCVTCLHTQWCSEDAHTWKPRVAGLSLDCTLEWPEELLKRPSIAVLQAN